MIKTIVMSATYRQSSRHRPELRERDPQNRYLWRQNRFRAEAEIVRDLCLSVSGLLSRKVGGPSVFPPMPPDIAALSYANNFKWNTSKGADRYRRGMYTFFKRTAPDPNLITFDCPDSNTTCVERRTSNTPLQALTMLNNVVFVESSRALGARLLKHPAPGDAERLDYAFRLCISRSPTALERQQFTDLLNTCRHWYGKHQDDAAKLAGKDRENTVPVGEAASWIATSRVIMNLDEFITRE